MFELEVRDRAWLLDRVSEFAKHQAIVDAILASMKDLEKAASDPARF